MILMFNSIISINDEEEKMIKKCKVFDVGCYVLVDMICALCND